MRLPLPGNRSIFSDSTAVKLYRFSYSSLSTITIVHSRFVVFSEFSLSVFLGLILQQRKGHSTRTMTRLAANAQLLSPQDAESVAIDIDGNKINDGDNDGK